jgi:hypothetical protein
VDAPQSVVSLEAVRSMLAQTRRDGRTFPSLSLLGETMAASPLVQYSINVTNTGDMDADDVRTHTTLSLIIGPCFTIL